MQFQITVTGFRNGKGQFANLANSLPGGAHEVFSRIGGEVQRLFEMKTPIHSGELAAGWAYTVSNSGDGAELILQNDVPYLEAVIKGRRPGYIHATNAEFLHFTWRGQEYFRKSVYHPGTKPNNFLEGIEDEAARVIMPEIDRVATLLIQRHLTPG